MLTSLAAMSLACSQDSGPREGSIVAVPLREAEVGDGRLFERLSAERTGIDFENRFDWDGARRHLYPHGYAGGGVCIGDYDSDGLPDVYLSSQVGRSRLFRQVQDLRFEDVSDAAGLPPAGDWGTGAVFADVDGDGRLDLYVCNYDAPNRLYVNAGNGTFEERGRQAGVDFSGATIMAAFADYDLDGDLDLYLVTNRLYPGPGRDHPNVVQRDGKAVLAPGQEESFVLQERNIDGETQKFVANVGQADRLYENDGRGSFRLVSERAGIHGNHPGLSATWWDADDDGDPDLYVCNDFWEPDRFYRNEGDGTFTDVLADSVPHTPWFSMGADFADVDGDGRMDFLAADMSATTHFMSKLMMGDMNESRWFLTSAEPRQYMRNALYLNTGTGRFMEVAQLAGLASTDWTWSVKFADADCDGRVDLFATNGTANHSFDPDLTREQRAIEDAFVRMRRPPADLYEAQWAAYRKRPPRREKNVAMRNLGDLSFLSMGEPWGLDAYGISFGAAWSDLDRDGDLDLVVSNVDDPVSVYANRGGGGQRILVRLVGAAGNAYGIGASVRVRTEAGVQVRQLHPTRGYMSADEPVLHFGLGREPVAKQLTVHWPSGHVQRFDELPAGFFYQITEPSRSPPARETPEAPPTLFGDVTSSTGLDAGFEPEVPYDDYEDQPLLPAKLSQLGPGMAWGDADGDGEDDVYIGGSAGRSGRLFVRRGGRFEVEPGPWDAERDREDAGVVWLDANSDGRLDLYVASGSVEFAAGDERLRDRLYLSQEGGGFVEATREALPDLRDASGPVAAADLDLDGDLDLFVGGRAIPGQYPLAPESRILRNDGGRFVDVTESVAPGLEQVGLVTAALWSDADGDGSPDLFVATEWGPIAYFHNAEGALEDHTQLSGLDQRTGWWSSVVGGDFDGDGDLDYLALNAGLNTKYSASREKPATLLYGDFEGSGRSCLVEAKDTGEEMLPVRGLSCSSDAMPFIKTHIGSYHQFASSVLGDIYPEDRLAQAQVFEANTLASGVYWNDGVQEHGLSFRFEPLARLAQASPGYGAVACDLDADGLTDVAFVQNFFEREPETGRWDGGLGLILRGTPSGLAPMPVAESGFVVPGDATALTLCDVNDDGRPDLAVCRNDAPPLVFANCGDGHSIAVRLAGEPGNATAVGARVALSVDGHLTQTSEVGAGSGYWSQSAPTLFFGVPPGSAQLELTVRWPDGHTSTLAVDPEQREVRVSRRP